VTEARPGALPLDPAKGKPLETITWGDYMTQPPARDQRRTATSEPDDWITRARRYTRPLVDAEGWSDEDIDRIIEEERAAVQPQPE